MLEQDMPGHTSGTRLATPYDSDQSRDLGRAVLKLEADAVAALVERIGEPFSEACQQMLACRGRVIVTGMGKSGHIGSKMAATLASTGTPAFFVHPGEASHGDLGMITPNDVLVALSNSGETSELTAILPLIKRLRVPLIALTGRADSTLAQAASVHLDVSVEREACPLGLAPTTSTTATLAMGDALAVALLDARGFSAEDFARSHPGGKLGCRLLVHIKDVMRTGEDLPRTYTGDSIRDAILVITQKRLGITAIVDREGRVLGIFTDGDLRRSLDHGADLHRTQIDALMNPDPVTVPAGMLAAEAGEVMQRHRVAVVLVTDSHDRLVGAVHLSDLVSANVI